MARLPAWLATVPVLELWMDVATDGGPLDCIGLVASLKELRLWGALLMASPAWGRLERLRVLEVGGRDTAVKDAIAAYPNLTDMSLLRDGGHRARSARALPARLALHHQLLAAPHMESLDVQSFTWITLRGGSGDVHYFFPLSSP
jgi:hypothetical protein